MFFFICTVVDGMQTLIRNYSPIKNQQQLAPCTPSTDPNDVTQAYHKSLKYFEDVITPTRVPLKQKVRELDRCLLIGKIKRADFILFFFL